MRFNPGFFYGKDRKHSVNERQVKRALDRRLTSINFSCLLGDNIGLITAHENIVFVPLP